MTLLCKKNVVAKSKEVKLLRKAVVQNGCFADDDYVRQSSIFY
jgi:hypothetical protein